MDNKEDIRAVLSELIRDGRYLPATDVLMGILDDALMRINSLEESLDDAQDAINELRHAETDSL